MTTTTTTSFMDSLPPAFCVESNEDPDHHQHHQFFGPNNHIGSSSSLYSYQFYFNPIQHQTGYSSNPSEVYPPQDQLQSNNGAIYGRSYEEENKVENGLKLSVGSSKEIEDGYKLTPPVKWRVMQKTKKSDRRCNQELPENINSIKFEDRKQQSPTSTEADYSSNSSSNNPIRVCADCNTTKTPLWRSGPKGPKSLCNACGIRQRKARRALAAAAAAAANGTPFVSETPKVKIKLPQKEKTKIKATTQTVPFKKRCKAFATSSTSSHQEHPKKKLSFEDFLLNLSNNLTFQNVFPQDEKEAAILLMALSCGLLHA